MARDRNEEMEEQEVQEVPSKKSKGKLIILLALAGVVILAMGGGGWYFLSKSASNEPVAKVQKPVTLQVWPMDTFIVNISDTEEERYLKVVIQLEVSDAGVIAELDQLKPRLRDSIIDLLTSKPYKDLIDLSAKQRLREDIAGRVNNALSKGKITKVYFTDFVMQ
ncbi:MAG: flagellar basal body-associated FliL family protein [Deltaproteobacteria bacterium]|nr:flagellar basal body-associated FliL family protein [Deltaproteobacteria bacterium]